jgi:hypothetical protein
MNDRFRSNEYVQIVSCFYYYFYHFYILQYLSFLMMSSKSCDVHIILATIDATMSD